MRGALVASYDPRCRTTPLSAVYDTAYSTYLEVASFIRNLRAPYRDNKGPTSETNPYIQTQFL